MSACCGPARESTRTAPAAPPADFAVPVRGRADLLRGMVAVPGGPFLMGGEDEDAFPDDGEGPVREVTTGPFHIDAACVSNARFAVFVKATGYRTEAELIGWSYVFGSFIPPEARRAVLPGTVPGAPWWRAVTGAHWRAPEGPGTSVGDRRDHPVVHMSWNDATAYARWAASGCPPRPNGRRRPGAASSGPGSPGATS